MPEPHPDTGKPPPGLSPTSVVHFHCCPSLLQLRGAIGRPRRIQGQDARGLPAFVGSAVELEDTVKPGVASDPLVLISVQRASLSRPRFFSYS